MRRFGCIPGLVMLAMAAAVVAMASALLSTSVIALAGMASMMLTQCLMGVGIIGLGAVGVAALALRNPFVRLAARTALTRKFNLPERTAESLPQAETKQAALPAAPQQVVAQPAVVIRPTVARRRVRVPPDTLKKWGF